MPILAPDPPIYPDGLLDADFSAPPEQRWWAIYTQSRQEKVLARHLWAFQVPFYLPLIAKDNVIRGRRVQSHVPLFPGYLFLFGSEDEQDVAMSTNRVSRILPVEDQPRLFEDLRQVRRLIAAGAPLTVEDRLLPGRRVRVAAGALAGLEGVVLSRRGKTQVLIAVDFLQRGVSVAMEDFLLEAVDGHFRECSTDK